MPSSTQRAATSETSAVAVQLVTRWRLEKGPGITHLVKLEIWKVCSGAIAAMGGGQSSVSGPQASFSITWRSTLRAMPASACRRSSLMVPTVGLVADGMTKAAHP